MTAYWGLVAAEPAAVSPPPPPGVPDVAGFSASPAGPSQLVLTWSYDGVDDLDIVIDHSPNGSTGWASLGTFGEQPPASHTGLSPGQTVHYRAKYADGLGNVSANYATTSGTTMSFG